MSPTEPVKHPIFHIWVTVIINGNKARSKRRKKNEINSISLDFCRTQEYLCLDSIRE